MKEKIHPKYGKSIVRCVCGETFETGSVKPELKVEICSKCPPLHKRQFSIYSGKLSYFYRTMGYLSEKKKNPQSLAALRVFFGGDCWTRTSDLLRIKRLPLVFKKQKFSISNGFRRF